MSPGKEIPEEQGWRWKTDEGEFDVGYAEQYPDGSSTEVLRAKGHVTEDKREAQLDAVLGRNNNDKTSGELLGVRGKYDLDERTAEGSVTGFQTTNKDQSGGLEVLNVSAEGDFGGFSDVRSRTEGTATTLRFQTDTHDIKIASAEANASTGDGKTVLGGEANLFSWTLKQGSGGNESQISFDVGIGGTGELYHGEDSDRDGYGEWGVKFPTIPHKQVKQAVEKFTERLVGSPVDLSGSFRVEPEAEWKRVQQAAGAVIRKLSPFDGDGGPPTPSVLFMNGKQASGMKRLDEAFARLQSLL